MQTKQIYQCQSAVFLVKTNYSKTLFLVHHHFCCRICSKFCEPSMLAKYGVSVSVWVWYGVWVRGCGDVRAGQTLSITPCRQQGFSPSTSPNEP